MTTSPHEFTYFQALALQLANILDRDLPIKERDRLAGLEGYLVRAVLEAMVADGSARFPHAGTRLVGDGASWTASLRQAERQTGPERPCSGPVQSERPGGGDNGQA